MGREKKKVEGKRGKILNAGAYETYRSLKNDVHESRLAVKPFLLAQKLLFCLDH